MTAKTVRMSKRKELLSLSRLVVQHVGVGSGATSAME